MISTEWGWITTSPIYTIWQMIMQKPIAVTEIPGCFCRLITYDLRPSMGILTPKTWIKAFLLLFSLGNKSFGLRIEWFSANLILLNDLFWLLLAIVIFYYVGKQKIIQQLLELPILFQSCPIFMTCPAGYTIFKHQACHFKVGSWA